MLGIQAKAQTDIFTLAPVEESTFGFFGGIDFQNINGKDADGNELKNSLVTRFNIGVNYEMPIAPEFFIQPGLQFITKGASGQVQYTTNSETRTITRKIKLSYLEMPVNFVYKPLLGKGHLILGFGPYFGYGIGGTARFNEEVAPEDSDLQFVKTVPPSDINELIYFRRMDVGANFFVGYQMANGINLLLNSQLGLVNINSTTTTKRENKNTGFGLALGYRFI